MNVAQLGKECKGQKLRTENWSVLASGLEAAAVRDRHTQILIRIDWSVVDANFIVEVWPGGSAAQADIADGIATMDLLPRSDREAGKVAVARRDAVAMVHHDELAVSALEIGEGNYAIRRCDHRVALGAADSHPAVKCGQRLGAELARNQSAVVALRVMPRLMPTMAAPVRAELRSALS